MRSEVLRANLVSFVKANLKEGTGKRTIKAEEGYLVLIKTSDHTKRGAYGVIKEIRNNENIGWSDDAGNKRETI